MQDHLRSLKEALGEANLAEFIRLKSANPYAVDDTYASVSELVIHDDDGDTVKLSFLGVCSMEINTGRHGLTELLPIAIETVDRGCEDLHVHVLSIERHEALEFFARSVSAVRLK